MKMGIMAGVYIGGIVAALLTPACAVSATLDEALTDGKVKLDIRYRYEYVDQNNSLKAANASTVRSRLGYLTGDYHDVSAYLEFENTTAMGAEDYNSLTNGKTEYSVIPDPELTEVNQAYVAWSGLQATVIKYGRQVINLDNQRFVGAVAWRQNEQTFDAFDIVNKSLPNTVVTYAHVSNVNQVTGNDAAMSSDLLNIGFSGWSAGKASAYAYLLDYDQSAAQSTQTYGLRFTGDHALGEDLKVLYTAEYARQSDYGKNPNGFDLNYMLAEAGGAWSGVTAKLGYEVLAGDGTYSVQTPLATLHAFNGWADQFLSTPANGLKDVYLSVGGKAAGLNLLAIYHDFSADKGSGDYGSETDLQVVKKIGKLYKLLAAYAAYSSGGAAGKVDTDKLWVMGQVSF